MGGRKTLKMLKSRSMRWAGHVERTDKMNSYTISVGKPDGKTPLGKPTKRREYYIKMDLRV
jgi:hypothetical protein